MPKLWAKSIGARGSRVRIYQSRRGGTLMRSVYLNGKEDRKSLGHRDRARAITEAYALLAQLNADAGALERGTLTMAALIARYTRSQSFLDNKPNTRRGDAGILARILRFYGPDMDVSTLGPADVKRYVHARRMGLVQSRGKPLKVTDGASRPGVAVKVRDGTIRADLVALKTALNWASLERDARGHRLLAENPLRGIEIPREKNPRRPVMTEDVFRALLAAADQIHSQLRMALIIAEGTGRRLSAWRQLRWDDVQFDAKPFGAIRWPADTDKQGYEQVVPISSAVRDVLLDARRKQKAIGTAWVFPTDHDPMVPTKREMFDQRLRRAYQLARITKEPGSLWHALRRKWATERKGYPISDVAAAGGWRDKPTLLESYQRADPETIQRVVLHPTMRLVGGT